MKKEYLLLTSLSDDEKKEFRTELNRYNIKVKEDFEKSLTSYFLTEDEVNSLDLNKVKVFRNMLRDGRSSGVAMIISQNPISYNRNFHFTEINHDIHNSLNYRDYSFTKEIAVSNNCDISMCNLIDKVIETGYYSYTDGEYLREFFPEVINNFNTITLKCSKINV